MSQIDDSLAISGADLKRAVAAGVVDGGTVDRLVAYVMASPVGDAADDERLRLITGFNDIFVAIGLTLFFGALFFVAGNWAYAIAPVAAWALAELFTRRMRMALPSIMLLVIFACSIFFGILYLFHTPGAGFYEWALDKRAPIVFAASAGATLIGVGLHWWRFHVPITIAAGVAATVGALMGALAAAIGDQFQNFAIYVLLVLGLGTFALAMFFDMQDRLRRTQMADRAFWLHMLAALLIIHPLMSNLREMGAGGAVSTFALFAFVALVALVIDRRALLVSSLGYLIVTFGSLAKSLSGSADWNAGSLASGWGVLMVGVLVLLLSVAWRPLRASLVPLLPMTVQDKVPVVQGQ